MWIFYREICQAAAYASAEPNKNVINLPVLSSKLSFPQEFGDSLWAHRFYPKRYCSAGEASRMNGFYCSLSVSCFHISVNLGILKVKKQKLFQGHCPSGALGVTTLEWSKICWMTARQWTTAASGDWKHKRWLAVLLLAILFLLLLLPQVHIWKHSLKVTAESCAADCEGGIQASFWWVMPSSLIMLLCSNHITCQPYVSGILFGITF